MPRFRNFYRCPACGSSWSDDWDATCDDDCPNCGERHVSPEESDDIVPECEPDESKSTILND